MPEEGAEAGDVLAGEDWLTATAVVGVVTVTRVFTGWPEVGTGVGAGSLASLPL